MKEIDHIEQLFGIKITSAQRHRQYTYDKPVTVEQAQAVVAANPDVAWQDPKNPDCGNDDGLLYLALSMPVPPEDLEIGDDPHYITLFAFDNSDMAFYIV